jgi:DNA-binding protein HU-beta
VTKKDLVAHVAAHASLTKKQAGMAVDAFLDGLSGAIAEKEGKVSLVGFGTFSNKTRAARTGVDPKTHARKTYPAKRVPHFKAGKTLKELVEKGPRRPAAKKH